MALPCLHESITREVLGQMGFSPRACDLAARANAAIDEKQGSGIEETKLHAMIGYVTDETDPLYGRLQTKEKTIKAVEQLLKDAKADILTAIQAREYAKAVNRLGQAHHTIQDRAFHNFEPWPYGGLVDAFLRDPNYMFCHALRDLGLISKLDLKSNASGIGLSIELTQPLVDRTPINGILGKRPHLRDWYFSVQGFTDFGKGPRRDFHAMRMPGPEGIDNQPLGSGLIFSISFGAAPGSIPPPTRPGEPSPSAGETTYKRMLTEGPAAGTKARDASLEFVKDIERMVRELESRIKMQQGMLNMGTKMWDDFLNMAR